MSNKELKEPRWPVGSLQWAIAEANGKSFRRKVDGPGYEMFAHGSRVLFAKSKFRYDITVEDLAATDWEVCE